MNNEERIKERYILYTFMPSLLHFLYSRGTLDKNLAYTSMELWDIVHDNSNLVEKINWYQVIYPKFVQSAKILFDNNDRYSGLILLVTAIEHIINKHLRDSLSYRGVSDRNITNIIRTTNIDGKFGWLLKLVSDTEIPNDLKIHINTMIEKRNILIHYKHVPTFIDNPFYLDEVDKYLSNTDFDTLFEIINELEEYLDYSLEIIDPLIIKTKEMANAMFDIPPHIRVADFNDFKRYLQS